MKSFLKMIIIINKKKPSLSVHRFTLVLGCGGAGLGRREHAEVSTELSLISCENV